MKNEKIRHENFLKGTSAKEVISPWLILFACCILIVPMLFIACTYSNEPGKFPVMSTDTTGRPTITGMSPVSGAVAGVREITITGSSLGIKNGTDTPWVTIGGVRPLIKEMHDAYITIYRPKLSNDHYDKTILVNVTDPKMLTTSSSFNYSVQAPGAITGDYSAANVPLGGVDFDSLENLYTISGKTCYRTDYAGVTQTTLLTAAALVPADFTSPPYICFGPGSNKKNLFVAAAGQSYIYRVAVFDTINKNNKPIKLAVPSAVNTLDFDENGNMYTAGNGNLYVADTSVGNSAAPIFTAISGYPGVTNLVRIRVVKQPSSEYIYIADSTHVWGSPIGGTSLSNVQILVDLSAHSELSGCTISSFDVDHNGSIFLCLQHNPKYSLFFVEIDGSITPFYKDPAILPNTVDKLVWGNSNNLYLISSTIQSASGAYASGRIYRMILDRNGAGYGGRSFVH